MRLAATVQSAAEAGQIWQPARKIRIRSCFMDTAVLGCIGQEKIAGQKNAPPTIAQNASAAKVVSSTFIRPAPQAAFSQATRLIFAATAR